MDNPIRVYREANELTLDAFAQRVGVKRAAVSKWESGVRPSVASAQRIEAATGISKSILRPDVWPMFDSGQSELSSVEAVA